MTFGLVLSGGGARGIAHAGVIKALEEFGLKFSVIAGTSAGSIVGSLYSYGYKPDEIIQLISSTSFIRSIRPAWTLTGLFTMEILHEALRKYMPENNFSALKIPVTIAATNIRQGTTQYFTQGELFPAIMSSCCVPAVFNPVSFDGNLYVDGGLTDNLPASSIRDKCDFLIGAHCNHITPDFNVKNFRTVIERSLLIAINGNTVLSKALCNVLIEPPDVGRISGFDISKAKDLFEIGYRFTIQNFRREDFVP
jgi:NTE family protein